MITTKLQQFGLIDWSGHRSPLASSTSRDMILSVLLSALIIRSFAQNEIDFDNPGPLEKGYLFRFSPILPVGSARRHVFWEREQMHECGDGLGNCGTAGSNWKPCIERKVADQVFGSCCERFVPPECRGLCIYETNAIEARVVVSIRI
ncbi:hypothetical protein COOONC_00915 [Cooperia oncophora]